MPQEILTAIALAVTAAVLYAHGARCQHRAVRTVKASGARELRWSAMRGLLRDGEWLRGLALLGAGTGLQVVALSLAPITVVHPIGVLALAATAVLDARDGHNGRHGRDGPIPPNGTAIVACTVGVGVFVAVAASGVHPAVATDAGADAARVVGLLAVAVPVAGAVAVLGPGRPSCLTWTVGAGVAFGFVAALTRVVGGQVAAGGPDGVPPVAVAGLAAAALLGGWCLQQAHAGGPTPLVVAGLTVVDPLVAVGIGLAVLGEGAGIGGLTATVMGGCAALAVAGVSVLARRSGARVPVAEVTR